VLADLVQFKIRGRRALAQAAADLVLRRMAVPVAQESTAPAAAAVAARWARSPAARAATAAQGS